MRAPGWEQRLTELMADAQTRPFAFGAWDCCLFACAAIAAVTGTDPAAAHRGQYNGEGCAAYLEAQGGVLGVARRTAAACGFKRIRPVLARRGDVVFGVIDGQATLGVCVGPRVAFLAHPAGVATVPITAPSLLAAWEIG